VVDSLPVRPGLDVEPPSEAALGVNCFYPPGFATHEGRGRREHALAIIGLAAQGAPVLGGEAFPRHRCGWHELAGA
jgi:hypothetical protein